MIDSVSELNLDPADEAQVKKLISEKTYSLRNSKKEPLPDALENIERKLAEELKKANLFHLFVLWENTIAMSAIETVNSIYKAIPDTIPKEKKLRAMLFYLAYYNLEKQRCSDKCTSSELLAIPFHRLQNRGQFSLRSLPR